MRRPWITLLTIGSLLATFPQRAVAQAMGSIVGTVVDSAGRQTLANATITVDGRYNARTSADGRYSITQIPIGTHTVRVQLLGYAVAEGNVAVTAGSPATFNVALRAVSISLQQLVVVGYGSQKRSDLTGAVSTVTPAVERTPMTSLEQSLQGTAAGVQVTQASSAPGGGMSIRIRGASSVNGNNEPLYVIDGFPIENNPASDGDPTNGGRTNTAPANPLAALNPSDIASIEILKDASATSIYGSRGANGVIIITTKRGETGKPRFTVDAYSGTQSVAQRYDLLNGTEFATFANEWAVAQGKTAPYADPSVFGVGTDWQSAIFRNAPISNVQLGVTGGTANANTTHYALSGGVFRQLGVVDNSDFRRISVRGNIDQTVGRLKLATNLFISRVSSSQVPTDGTFNAGAGAVGAAIQYAPIIPIRLADGTYTLNRNDYPAELRAAGAAPGDIPNPVSMALDVIDKLGDTRTLGNAYAEYTLVPGLVARATAGADLSSRTRDTYYPRTTLMGQNFNGRAIRGQNQNTSFLNENTLTYQHNFAGVNDVTAVIGYTRQIQTQVREGLANSNFVSDINSFDDIGSGTQTGGPTVSSNRTRYTLASYLSRLNYTLKDRYLLTATARRDGSSRFGSNHQWGVFPSVGAGWRVSEESFMQRFTFIDALKLRASTGTTGNPSIQPYQSLTRLATGKYAINGTTANGYVPSLLGNEDLSWESTRQTDYAIETTLFKGRFDGSFDTYDRKTNDLLLSIDLPSETGFASALVNTGSISNKGIEVTATVRPFMGNANGSFAWSSTVTYTRNRNKVLDLGGPQRIFASSIAPDLQSSGTVVQVGQPIGAFFGYQTAGVIRDSAAAANYTVLIGGTRQGAGQIRYVDQNGDGIIDANDRTIIGDPNPRYLLGWQNTVSLKGFELSGSFDGTFGNKILNLNLYRVEGGGPITNITRDRFNDRWTPDNPDAKYPKVNSAPGALGAEFTDYLLQDGSFFRLRTVTLSRTVPQFLIRNAGFTSGRLFVTGSNLWTHTDYRGFNPDVSSQGVGNLNRGIDSGAYPLARTWTFGFNLSY